MKKPKHHRQGNINPERRARKRICKELGITNKKFRKLNRNNVFAKYNYLRQEYKTVNK